MLFYFKILKQLSNVRGPWFVAFPYIYYKQIISDKVKKITKSTCTLFLFPQSQVYISNFIMLYVFVIFCDILFIITCIFSPKTTTFILSVTHVSYLIILSNDFLCKLIKYSLIYLVNYLFLLNILIHITCFINFRSICAL
jgi:hypothetical protein